MSVRDMSNASLSEAWYRLMDQRDGDLGSSDTPSCMAAHASDATLEDIEREFSRRAVTA